VVQARFGGLGRVLGAGAWGHDHVGDGGDLDDRLADLPDELGLHHQAPGRGVVQDVGDLLGPPAQVDRHADQAELGTGEVDGKELGAVGGGQAERVAAAQPPGGQPVRELVHPPVELRIAPPPATVHDGGLVRPGRRGPGQRIAHVDPLDEVARQVHRPFLPNASARRL
jgi:hypothetical protein